MPLSSALPTCEYESGWTSRLLDAAGVKYWFSTVNPPSDAWIALRLAGPRGVPARLRQIHSCAWKDARECCTATQRLEGDAIISRDPLAVPIVSTADCVPVLVVCTSSRTVAAIHAGWRGIVSGVIPATVRAMRDEYGANPTTMIAARGPCAGKHSYEVGADVIGAMTAAGLSRRVDMRSNEKALVDCAGAALDQLIECGVPADLVDIEPPCTIEGRNYASYRRNPSSPVRMLAGIACPG